MQDQTNEQLALRIKDGEEFLLPQLWTQVERFVRMKARQYAHRAEESGRGLHGCELEDLEQAGYFAVVSAVRYYNAESGFTFLTFLSNTLKTSFSEAQNIRTSRAQNDMLNSAGSLDEPFSEADDSSLHDVIADTCTEAEGSVEEIALNRAYRVQLHAALEKCLTSLPDLQERIIRERYYKGLTFNQIGEGLGYSHQGVRQIEDRALRKMREEIESNGLSNFLDVNTNFHLNVGVRRFKSQWVSSVELLVLKREELAQRWMRQHEVARRNAAKREYLAKQYLKAKQAERRK